MRLNIRTLNDEDISMAEELDDMSDFYVSQWLDGVGPEESEYAWGIFDESRLIGYLTIGGADDVGGEIENYPAYNNDNLLLSDVFVMPEYRNQGVATKIINDAIERHSETKDNLIFLTYVNCDLHDFYKKLGFEDVSKSEEVWAMVKKIR